jgi:hypothetical protein
MGRTRGLPNLLLRMMLVQKKSKYKKYSTVAESESTVRTDDRT